MLYPLKFKPIPKERIWGGDRLKKYSCDNSNAANKHPIGECWILSAVEDDVSIVENGFLKGNTLEELVEVYMGDLVGDSIYERFGVEFPLLVKLIDTKEFLSVQIHPDDEMAEERHHAYGKSEFWYILDAKDDSQIITGFDRELTKEEYVELVKKGKLQTVLKYNSVKPNDFIYIPARSLHSLGKDIFLIEIQQTSDITYRVFDWNRVDSQGKSRELHVDLAADTIGFDDKPLHVSHLPLEKNQETELTANPFFRVNRFCLEGNIQRELLGFDSFRLYICIAGKLSLNAQGSDAVVLTEGEVVLVPASIPLVEIQPLGGEANMLEVFVG